MYIYFIRIGASTVYNSQYAALVSNVRTKNEPPGDDGEQTLPSRRNSGLCNTWGVVNAAIAAAATAAALGETILD